MQFLEQNSTIIVLVIAAVIAIGLIFWRSKREERRSSKESGLGIAAQNKAADVLAGPEKRASADERLEPELAASTGFDEFPEDDAPALKAIDPTLAPSEEPPVYREEARQIRDAEAKKAEEAEELRLLQRRPPVDEDVEWVLDISPKEGLQFSLGGVQALAQEMKKLHLPLLVRIWAQSSRDGLYYEAEKLSSPARHVVAAMVLANRAAKLDEVMASGFYQVLDQSAAQSDVAVRRRLEPMQAAHRSAQLKDFIDYYSLAFNVLIEPTDPSAPFTVEMIDEAARAAGFELGSGCWQYRIEPADREPVITLAFGEGGTKSLALTLDVPLANLDRGDLRLLFSLANHLACALHAVWLDMAHNPIDAGGAMLVEAQIRARNEEMAKSGVEAGSERAKLLFARSA